MKKEVKEKAKEKQKNSYLLEKAKEKWIRMKM